YGQATNDFTSPSCFKRRRYVRQKPRFNCYNFESAAVRRVQPVIAFQIGQVAQMVERSPEKAGVGGSIPSLATIIRNAVGIDCFPNPGRISALLSFLRR